MEKQKEVITKNIEKVIQNRHQARETYKKLDDSVLDLILSVSNYIRLKKQ